MRLITELCEENQLGAIINIHDVALAQMFSERIVGLREGSIVYDGSPDDLKPDVLTEIYGKEDWTAVRERKSIKDKDYKIDDVSSTEERMAEML